MSPDLTALLASFVYLFAMIGVAEGLRAWRGYPVDFTRKFVHIAVGMWAYGTIWLFERRLMALIPPLTFVVINAVSYWQGTFKAMEGDEKGNLGTVYFPIAFAVIIGLFWERPHLLVGALMPMTWGDALAAVFGRRIGQRPYTVLGTTRSWEGSTLMFAASWIATAVALIALSPAHMEPWQGIWIAGATALGATVVEALSPWGIDNLTVPAASALTLALLS